MVANHDTGGDRSVAVAPNDDQPDYEAMLSEIGINPTARDRYYLLDGRVCELLTRRHDTLRFRDPEYGIRAIPIVDLYADAQQGNDPVPLNRCLAAADETILPDTTVEQLTKILRTIDERDLAAEESTALAAAVRSALETLTDATEA